MRTDSPNEFLAVALNAAHAAGALLLSNIGKLSKEDIGLKQAADFVTRVDRESQQTILSTIKASFPDHTFLAEEGVNEKIDTYRWIVDPLDGTTNYVHEFPVFCVSIGLEHQGEIVLGVVFDPLKGELFTAEKGKGAFLNTTPLHVSDISAMSRSLVATGFPFRRKELIDPYLQLFKNIFVQVSDIRRAGSAALDLAYIACGRCEGFYELNLSPWDVAAGSIIIREAGGVVTDFKGGDTFLSTGNIVAGNPSIHPLLLKEVKGVFQGIVNE